MFWSRPRGAGYEGLLPGRTRWVQMCHAEPAGCARCLEAMAAFLAEEMGHDLGAALDRPTEAYQAELGAELCTLDQARELRRLTCEACFRRQHEYIGTPIHSVTSFTVADLDLAEASAR